MYVYFKNSMLKYCVYTKQGKCIATLFNTRKEAEQFILNK
jgi:hypothetical protein